MSSTQVVRDSCLDSFLLRRGIGLISWDSLAPRFFAANGLAAWWDLLGQNMMFILHFISSQQDPYRCVNRYSLRNQQQSTSRFTATEERLIVRKQPIATTARPGGQRNLYYCETRRPASLYWISHISQKQLYSIRASPVVLYKACKKMSQREGTWFNARSSFSSSSGWRTVTTVPVQFSESLVRDISILCKALGSWVTPACFHALPQQTFGSCVSRMKWHFGMGIRRCISNPNYYPNKAIVGKSLVAWFIGSTFSTNK